MYRIFAAALVSLTAALGGVAEAQEQADDPLRQAEVRRLVWAAADAPEPGFQGALEELRTFPGVTWREDHDTLAAGRDYTELPLPKPAVSDADEHTRHTGSPRLTLRGTRSTLRRATLRADVRQDRTMTDDNAPLRPLRIALVTIADLSVRSGITRTIELLSEGLRDRGHQVRIVACSLRDASVPPLIKRVWRRVSHSTEEFARIRRAVERTEERVAGEDTDVCLAMSAWAARACVRAGCPTVFRMAGDGSITDEWLRNGFIDAGSTVVETLRMWEREGTSGAAGCVALGESGRRALVDAGVAAERIAVIPVAVRIPAAAANRRTKEPGDRLRVLAVGNLRRVKGADVLAEALAALPTDLRRRVRLDHYGEGNDPSNPVFAAASARIDEAGIHATFHGAVPHNDVLAALASADVFAFPSRVESFGNALVEALAFGLPVVATDVGAVRFILGDDAVAAGLVVPPEDAAALALALERLLCSAELQAEWAERNARRAREEFGLEAILDRYEHVLRLAPPSHEVARQ